MAEYIGCGLDENTRRYYLETMGIQCWQALTPTVSEAGSQPEQTDADEAAALAVPEAAAPGRAQRQAPEKRLDPEQALPLPVIIERCQSCELHTNRRRTLVDRGSKAADVAFVLLAPAPEDEDAGALCSGDSGELFSKMLAAIDLRLDDVYVTTLLKCPPAPGHTITPAEVKACSSHLEQQLRVVLPRLVVVMGETAAQCLLQQDSPIDRLRESVNPGAGQAENHAFRVAELPLLVSYSPEELLRQPQHKRKAWYDLQQLQSLLQDD